MPDMMTQDNAPTVREIPRAIALRKLSDVSNWRGRSIYVSERSGRLSGPWVALSAAAVTAPDFLGEPMEFVELTAEADFWAGELLGADPTVRRVPVRFCVTVAL